MHYFLCESFYIYISQQKLCSVSATPIVIIYPHLLLFVRWATRTYTSEMEKKIYIYIGENAHRPHHPQHNEHIAERHIYTKCLASNSK